MPPPPKVVKQTREQICSKLPADYLAKRLRDEEERTQRERIKTNERLDEEFNEWLRQVQIKKEQQTQCRRESIREQSSENPDLIAAGITLEIPIDSNMNEIRQAYYRLARQTHPDKHPNDQNANAKFQAIGSAYQKLSSMPKKGGNKCRNRRTSHHRPKKTQTHRHTTHHRKTHRNYN
jgi:hypothetical protein